MGLKSLLFDTVCPSFHGLQVDTYVECTLKGVKHQEARLSVTRPQSRLPITPGILRHLRGIWGRNPHDYDAIMLWAACCMCFFGFLRSGEVTVSSMREYDQEAHLSEGDVMVDSVSKPTVVQVRIKTDPFRKGVMVYLGLLRMSCARSLQ